MPAVSGHRSNRQVKYTLPTDSADRKNIPLAEGVLAYFPAALAGVARVSKAGNDKHNPGEPLHHARGKSSDHADCIVRHLVDVLDLLSAVKHARARELITPALLNEVNQLAWRALALSQEIHEKYGDAPLAPNAVEEAKPEDIKPGKITLIPNGGDVYFSGAVPRYYGKNYDNQY
jgi:hypothetical protein